MNTLDHSLKRIDSKFSPKSILVPLATVVAMHSACLHESIGQKIEATQHAVRAAIDPTYDKLRKLKGLRPIDHAAEAKFKQEVVRMLENGEDIPLEWFTFQTERVSQGMTVFEGRNAKASLEEDMSELAVNKPEVPNKQILEKIVDQNFEEGEEADDYALTLTSVTRYFNRKGEKRRGNCEAKALAIAIVLEKLYPDRKNSIEIQKIKTDDDWHIRTVYSIPEEGKTYILEPGVQEITDENKEGTAFYNVRDHIANYAGDPRFIRPLQTVPFSSEDSNVVEFIRSMKLLPTPTETIYSTPPIEGRFKTYPFGSEDDRWELEAAYLDDDIKKEKEALRVAKLLDAQEVEIWPQDFSVEDVKKIGPVHEKGRKWYITSGYKNPSAEALKLVGCPNETEMEDLCAIRYKADIRNFSNAALAEIARTKAGSLTIYMDSGSLPNGFLDNMHSLKVLTLALSSKTADGEIDTETLQKVFERQKHCYGIVLHNFKISSEQAALIAGDRVCYVVRIITNTALDEEVLSILASSPNPVLIDTNKESFEHYHKSVKWLKYNDDSVDWPKETEGILGYNKLVIRIW